MRYEISSPCEVDLGCREVTVRGWCLDGGGEELRGMRARAGGAEFKVRRKLPTLALMAKYPGNGEAGFAGFEVEVKVPGGRSEIVLEAKGGEGKWEKVGVVKVRAPRIGVGRKRDGFDYGAWVEGSWNAVTKAEVGEMVRRGDSLQNKARFTVVADDPSGAGRGLAGQWYRRWQVVAPGARVGEGYVVFLRAGERLAPEALFLLAEEIDRHDGADLVYGDEDRAGPDGRVPHFKPDFDLELLRETDYVTRGGAFRAGAFQGLPATRALALEAAAGFRAGNVGHVPRVLYHRSGAAAAPVSMVPDVVGAEPRVAIIIPTRDRLSLLRACVESIRENTAYRNYEIVIVDNGSEEAETREYLGRFAGKVIDAPGAFNYAGLNNRAVREAEGAEVVVLLNNDIEVPETSRGWLGALVGCAVRPGVGAVGAHLFYPDGKIQHAGVFLGYRDAAGHLYHGLDADGPDLMMRRGLTHGVSAVTGACLAVWRTAYLAAGGMDEGVFAVNYNDVDLCLNLAEAGAVNVVTPHAKLLHHESASRGSEATGEQKEKAKGEMVALYRKWGSRIARDRYYNENLSVEREDGSLAWPPRWVPPWRR